MAAEKEDDSFEKIGETEEEKRRKKEKKKEKKSKDTEALPVATTDAKSLRDRVADAEIQLREGKPSAAFEEATQVLASLTSATGAEAQWARDVAVARLMAAVLTRADALGSENKARAAQFLLACMLYSIPHINDGPEPRELLLALHRFFNTAHPLYGVKRADIQDPTLRRMFFGDESNSSAEAAPAEKWARVQRGGLFSDGGAAGLPSAAALYVAHVNAFGTAGGFEACLARLRMPADKYWLASARHTLKVLVVMKEALTSAKEGGTWLEAYLNDVQKVVFERLLIATEEELSRDDKVLFREVGAAVQHILARVMSEDSLDELVERFNLDMGIRALRSKAVERRARGIRHIRKIVQRGLAKAEEKRGFTRFAALVNHGGSDGRKAGEPKALEAAFLIKWLKDQSVVEMLVKEEHPDVLRAGVVVLQFMAHANELDLPTTLQALWRLQTGKHESVKRVVFASLLDLVPYLPVRGIEILGELVRAAPAVELEPEMLRFVRDLSRLVTTRSPALTPKQWNGCAVLWQVVQDESQATPAVVASTALQLLLTLLMSAVAAHLQRTYAEAALDNVLKGVAVSASLELITRIVEAQAKRGQRKRSGAAPLLEALEARSKGLVRTVLKDMRVGGKASKAKGTVAQRCAMAFLEAVLLNSALSISPSELDDLWDLCVTGRDASEAGAFFKWLEALADGASQEGGAGAGGLDEALIEHVFHKMCALDAQAMDATAFSLFVRFFLRHNERAGKLKTTTATGRKEPHYFAVASELGGARNLWAIALDARDERVALGAAQALNSLYQMHANADSLKARSNRLRDEHVKTAVQLLNSALTSKGQSQSRAQRILSLLSLLIRDFARPALPTAPIDGLAALGSGVTSQVGGNKEVTFLIRADSGAHFRLVLSASTDVAELRQRIAEAYGRPVALLRIALSDGPELTELCPDITVPLSHAPIPTGAILSVRLDESPSPLHDSHLLGTKKEKEAGASWNLLKSEPRGEELKAVLLELLQMGMRAAGLQGYDSARLHALATSSASTTSTATGAPSGTHVPGAPIPSGTVSTTSTSVVPSGTLSPTSSTSSLHTTPSASNLPSLSNIAGADATSAAGHPLRLLSGADVYASLTSALEASDTVARAAWELLRSVPPPEPLLAELRHDWRRLADAHAPRYLLLHRLGLLATIASEPAMPDRLIASGATAAVLALLPASDEQVPSASSAPLLAVLCRVLTELLTRPAASAFERTIRPGVREAAALGPRLVALTWNALKADATQAPQVMRAGLPLLMACVSADEAHMAAFFEFAPLPAFLRALLLVPDRPARQLAAECLAHLAQATQHARQRKDSQLKVKPLGFLVDGLLASLPSIAADLALRTHCAELFTLVCRLMLLQRRANDFPIDAWIERFPHLVALVRERPVLEPGESTVGAEDHVLIGLLRVAAQALRGAPALKNSAATRGLVEEVWGEGLFALPSAERHGAHAPPKCKSRQARAAAFDLLAEAAKDCAANSCALAELVDRLVDGLRAVRDWTHVVGERERSLLGYVGLVNQGATCYMNALLQQLFLVPEFRAGLLRAPDHSDGAKDSLLYQLQVLFGNLHESARRAFDTIDFCGSCRDADGRPINTGQQMDANEFFNMLFDRLETHLKGAAQERLLKDLFGGSLASQLILRDCAHSSEREEPFFTLSLEVKSKKRLEECLDLFVQGENLDEYKCENCNERRNTLKRQCIKVLPRILLLHLKRFEFDLEALRHVKLNDSLSFPLHLNLEPYTREGIARRETDEKSQSLSPSTSPTPTVANGGDAGAGTGNASANAQTQPYEYELVGVVVHSGTADAGHYYSFIRERLPSGRWYEFNDSTVAPFSPERIPDECYGGTEEVLVPDRERGGQKRVQRAKANNAYILVYERSNSRDVNALVAANAPLPALVLPPSATGNSLPSPSSNSSGGSLAPPSPSSAHHHRSRSKERTEGKKEKEGSKVKKHKEKKHSHSHSVEIALTTTSGAPSVDSSASLVPSVVSSEAIGKEPSSINANANTGDDDSDKEMKDKGDPSKAVAAPVHFDLAVQLPQRIRTQVWETNKDFVAERRVFSPEFFAFAWTLVHLRPSDDAAHLRVVQLETRLTHEVIARTKDRNLLSAWLSHLARQYGASQAAARWFLSAQDLPRVRSSLLQCPAEATREAYIDICAPLFRVLAPLERTDYEKHLATFNAPNELKDTEAADDEEFRKRVTESAPGPAVRFIETLLHLLRVSVRRTPRQAAQLFRLLRQWALTGAEERSYLCKRGVIRLLLDLYLGPPPPVGLPTGPNALASPASAMATPVVTSSTTSTPASDPKRLIQAPYAYSPLAFGAMMDALSVLLRGSNLYSLPVRLLDDKDDGKARSKSSKDDKDKHSDMPTAPPGQLLPCIELRVPDVELVTSRTLWPRVIREDLNPDANKELVAFMCWENRPSTRFFLALAREGLTTLKTSELRQFLRVLVALMVVRDSLSVQRAAECGNILLAAMLEQKHSKEATEMLVDFTTKSQPERSDEFRAWAHKHKDQVSHTVRDVQAHLERLRYEAQRGRENAAH